MKFYSSHTHIANLGPLQFAKRLAYCAPKSWKKIPLGMWILDEWSANYFHWMTDCLPRLWEGLEREPGCPVILPESFRSLPYVTQSLELIGAKVLFFKASQNLHVERLILTARTATFPNFLPELAQKTRNKLSLTPATKPWRKVYVSRKLTPKRKAHNDAEVEILLQKKGVEIVYAEKLSLTQQIQLMSETKLLVCLHGAALTNMLFLPPSSKVLEFRNQGDSVTQCYFNLASALGLPYYYTLNQADGKDSIMSDFTIDLGALTRAIGLIEQDELAST